jgi:hypothetical protein
MIIISITAFLVALFLLLYFTYPSIKNFSNTKIIVKKEIIDNLSSDRNSAYNNLLLKREELKLITNEKNNYCHTIKLFENFYNNKEKNHADYLKNKYEKEFIAKKKKITNKLISTMFDKDMQEIFKNYTCDVNMLEKKLEIFLTDK